MLNIGWISKKLDPSIIQNITCLLNLKDAPQSAYRSLIVNNDETELDIENVVNINQSRKRDWFYRILDIGTGIGISPSVLRFAFQLDTLEARTLVNTGANRNIMLLAQPNRRFISLDDDVRWDVRKAQVANGVIDNVQGLTSNTLENPYRYQFFQSQKGLNEFLSDCKKIPVYELFCEMERRTHVDIGDTYDVALVTCGFYGDIGATSPKIIFALSRDEVLKIPKLESELMSTLNSRLVYRQPETSSLSFHAQLMMPAICINSTLDLPPFFPIGRNQDGAYSFALQACLPKSKIMHLPYAIAHQPFQKRTGLPIHRKIVFRVNDFLIMILSSLLGTGNLLNRNSENIGKLLCKIANAPAPIFFDFLLFISEAMLRSRIDRFKALLDNPAYAEQHSWKKLVLAEIYAMEFCLLDQQRVIPKEVRELQMNSTKLRVSSLEIFQGWLRKYAELLQVWKTLKTCAAETRPFET